MLSLGVRYLLRLLPILLIPPISTALFLSTIKVELHATIRAVLSLLSLPCGLFLVVQWNDYNDRTQARALGAVLPPRVGDTSIGGLNTMRSMVNNFQKGYLGKSIRRAFLVVTELWVQGIIWPSGRLHSVPYSISE
jgi:hypothetical protein